MTTFNPDIFYHIGQLSTASQRNPSAVPQFIAKSSKQVVQGQRLIEKYGCPDVETFYAKNPLKLSLTPIWYIYAADPVSGTLSYVAGSNLGSSDTRRRQRPARRTEKEAPQPGLGDQMQSMFEGFVTQQQQLMTQIATLQENVLKLQTELLERDRKCLELEKSAEVLAERHKSDLAVMQAQCDERIRAMKEQQDRERDVLAHEATVAAQQLMDEEKSSTFTGLVQRYEPIVRPLLEGLGTLAVNAITKKSGLLAAPSAPAPQEHLAHGGAPARSIIDPYGTQDMEYQEVHS